MTLEFIEAPSPNFDARTAPPDMLVLHYTGMQTGAGGAGAAARSGGQGLGPLHGRGGRPHLPPGARGAPRLARRRLVLEGRARHQRASRSASRSSIPATSSATAPFPDAQIDAVIDLVGDIRSRWTIDDDRIVGHSDVAPGRKDDPGELFPWKRLAEAGHGLWVEPPPRPARRWPRARRAPASSPCRPAFTRLGYDLRAVRPVRRRHHGGGRAPSSGTGGQDRVDGVADGETRARLIALLRLAG